MDAKQQSEVVLHDGQRMPQLGLGVWQTPPDDAAKVVSAAVGLGYRAVDTAAGYNNEEGVGLALADHPDVFLTTKLRNEDQGFDEALRAFEASARKLRRDTIDLYLIHWPSPWRGRYVESWKALVRLQKEGRITSIGVSNFTAEHLDRIIGETGVSPVLNQIEVHPRFQQTAMREADAKRDVVTESWSPLGQGSILNDPVLTAIGQRYGKTAAQVIIRWHLDSGLVVIPKSVRPERMK
ncbi:MAG: aldo/keto reductase, partial [Caulobacteraceae bacterium]|nr:aldo/keto reductase [Caulobacter sp.]